MKLTRFAYFDKCTLGHLVLPTGLKLYTIERPWLNNKPFISCVPEGSYPLEWDTTGRIAQVPRLRDTAPRTQINIHSANWAHELHGCIAPGLSYSIDVGKCMVHSSNAAMVLLMEQFSNFNSNTDGLTLMLGDENAILTITSTRALVA